MQYHVYFFKVIGFAFICKTLRAYMLSFVLGMLDTCCFQIHVACNILKIDDNLITIKINTFTYIFWSL